MSNTPRVKRLTTADDVTWLLEQLADKSIRYPWVVMSTAAGEAATRIPWEDILGEIGDVAKCVELVHGEATYTFADLIGESMGVWAGAARVYPAGFTPGGDLIPAKARTTSRLGSNERAKQAIISDALNFAYLSGLFVQRNDTATAVEGTITAFIASRALVTVSTPNALATLAEETTYPGVPLEWVFQVGQKIRGSFDQESKRFIVAKEVPTAQKLLEHFGHRSVTLGLVTGVERQKGTIALHPGLTFPLTRERLSPNPKDRVDLLLAEGEVVLVRIFRDEQGRPAIRLDDIDDDETVLPALVLGNGPWLIDGREKVADEDLVDDGALAPDSPDLEIPISDEQPHPEPLATPTVPTPGPGPRPALASPSVKQDDKKPALREALTQLETARARIALLERKLQQLGGARASDILEQLRNERNDAYREVSDLRGELIGLKADLAELRKRSRETRQQTRSSDPRTRQSRFSRLDDWFHEEIRRTWISLYTPQERERHPLDTSRYTIGASFLETLEPLSEGQLRRLFKLIVHTVTGRNGEERIIEVHPLRDGDAVTAAPRIRDDGSVCLRAYVEEGVPQSKRLHFWKLTDGTVELGRVVMHDDMEP